MRKRTLAPSEDAIHVSVAEMLRIILPSSVLWTTWEARNAASLAEGRRRKSCGLRKGWPDIGIFHYGKALFVELKSKSGRVSPEQIMVHESIVANGFYVAVCHSCDEVLAALDANGFPHMASSHTRHAEALLAEAKRLHVAAVGDAV